MPQSAANGTMTSESGPWAGGRAWVGRGSSGKGQSLLERDPAALEPLALVHAPMRNVEDH
jgi:hypothetical protein